MKVKIKRAYEAYSAKDGVRILVDRLWPRGLKKEALRLDAWIKDLAPSAELRTWFCHDPESFREFEKRYFQELAKNKQIWQPLLQPYLHKPLTLIYAAKDPQINNAICLKKYLEKEFG